MTIKELSKFTPEEKRVKIAETCGKAKRYKRLLDGKIFLMMHAPVVGRHWQETKEQVTDIDSCVSNYLNDLNAMHEAEKTAFPNYKKKQAYYDRLCGVCNGINTFHATATQRADAFLLCVGEKEEG